jgi:dihydroxyacetone kinase
MLPLPARSRHDYLPLSPGEEVALLVNNLGSTPPIEISIVVRRAVHVSRTAREAVPTSTRDAQT